MMRATIACVGMLVWLCLSAAVAQAQPLQVRGGEHADFTRIVVPLPAGQAWRFGRSSDGYGLRFDGGAAAFDTSVAFDRIPRTRLAGLAARTGGLDLRVTCDCHAVAFEDGGGRLVMDIRDGPAPRGSRFEQPLEVAARRPAFDWISTFDIADPQAPRPGGHPAPPSPVPVPTVTASPIRPSEGARDLLIREFARAGAQGLLGDWVALPPDRAVSPPGGIDPLANLGIHAETAVDRARRGQGQATLQPDGSPCLPDALFDLAAWGDDRPAPEQIAEQRARLVGEFDRVQPPAVDALARLYLHFGFGAEARALLQALPSGLPDADLLAALGTILDDPIPTEGLPFSGMEGCDGSVAMWAMLAAPTGPTAQVDGAAVRRAFSALPPALRHHLGPPLVQRFRALDDPESALHVRNALGRAAGDHGGGRDLVEAEIAIAEGRLRQADATLQPLVAGNTPSAPEALALQVEARMAAGAGIDPETVRHLAAMAAEHRGSPAGLRLARLHALGLSAEGRFDAAFAVHDGVAAQDAAIAAVLNEALLAALVEDADELTFLSRMMSRDGWRGGQLARPIRLAAAERFLSAGFPELVADALGAPERDALPEMLLRARAALELGEAQRALRHIAGAEGAEAAGLRAAALLALGDARASYAAAASAEAPEAALRALWHAGDWAGVAEHAEGAAGQLAEQVAAVGDDMALGDPSARLGVEVGVLTEARALIAAGEETRARVAALLSERPAP